MTTFWHRLWRRKGWVGLAALLMGLLAAAACGKQNQSAVHAEAPPAPSVTVAVAGQQPIPIEIDAIGNVQPYRTVQVKSMVDGQIAKVLLKQGQDVRAGQLLFQLDKRPFEAALNQAKGQLAKDQANLWNSRAQANRNNALQKAGVVAPAVAQQLEAQARADAASVQADQAAVQTAEVNLSYTDIRSPIDARAGAILVNLGNLVKANDTNALATLNQIEPIYVQFNIPEAQLEAVRAKGVGKLKVMAAPPGDPVHSAGVLTFINNTVDQSTGTIQLMGTFVNRDRRLWPGEFLNVQLELGIDPHAVVVPATAVQNGQQGKYVYAVRADGTATVQPVQTSRNYGQLAVIDSGLKPGERVIVDGQIAVIPNNKVNVVRTVALAPAQAGFSAGGASAGGASTESASVAPQSSGVSR
jgi:multidrug efflux system membrane fusion protein